MSFLTALLLGILQGLTEFFPVSSSTHLAIVKTLLGTPPSLVFDLSCHFGTLLTLLWVLRKEWLSLFFHLNRFLYVTVALLPLIPAYFLFSHLRSEASLSPLFLAGSLCVSSVFLFLGSWWRPRVSSHPIRDALLIGTFQSTALIPGISRSASTLSCAQVLGWSPQEAVRFSFVLAIPTVLGGSLLEIYHLWKKREMGELFAMECFVGFITSFIVSLFVIRFALALLARGKLRWFAKYCACLALGICLYEMYLSL